MNSSTSQQRPKHIHITPVVEYSAGGGSEQQRPARPERPVVDKSFIAPVGLIGEGSTVLGRDGRAGYVARVVVDTRQGRPTHIIVRPSRLRRARYWVPFTCVIGIMPGYVELDLSRRQIERLPPYRPDYELAEAVEATFHGPQALHKRGDYLSIRATVENGIVTLRGNVRDAVRRLEAERSVSRMRGVLGIRNYLVVDDEIAWQAARRLERDPRLQLDGVRIETCLGLLRLHGKVASPEQRALAERIVEQVAGVQAINNGLTVG